MRKLDARQLAREKSLFRYSSALERADFNAVEAVLQEAERDSQLAQMIAEVNAVYESEAFRPSPSYSSNHREKDLIMTTIALPSRQRNAQRWLPITLAAACVSVLFFGALILRPRPNNPQLGIQAQSSATPTAAATETLIPSATFTHTPTPAAVIESGAIPATVAAPPNIEFSASEVGTPVCGGTKIISEDTFVRARPSNKSSILGGVPAGTSAETLVTGNAAEDDTSVPSTYWFFIKADVDGNSVQGWVSANVAQPIDPANPCTTNAIAVASQAIPVAVNAQPIFSVSGTTCDSTDAAIFSPSSNTMVEGTVDISGIATAPNFGSYKLEIIGLATGSQYTPLVNSPQAVITMGTLGQINFSTFPPDDYTLRLTVFNGAQQLQASCLMTFTLVNATGVSNAVAQPVVIPAVPTVQFSVVMPTPTIIPNGLVEGTVVAPDVAPAAIAATPTAYFDSAIRSNPPVIVILHQIGSIPANTQVQIESAGFDGTNWTYQIRSADGQSATISQADLIGVATIRPATTTAATGICHVTVQQSDSVQIYSGPSSRGDEAVLVNNLPPNVPASVLYQQRNQETGAIWYLVLAVMDQGKQISGWVSSDSVIPLDTCPPLP